MFELAFQHTICKLGIDMVILMWFSFQTLLSKAKEELEAEKRDLVRTLERRSLEVEHVNGTNIVSVFCLYKLSITLTGHLSYFLLLLQMT